MSIIVETGTGASDSESYASVSFADTYHYKRGNTDWGGLDTTAKEQLLRKATDYMVQQYRSAWKGSRVLDTQGLDWPRNNVSIDNSNSIDNDIVPSEVKKACCEFSLKSNGGTLLEDGGRVTISEKVDVLEVAYSDNGRSSNYVKYSSVDKMLSPYLMTGSASGGIVGRISRA